MKKEQVFKIGQKYEPQKCQEILMVPCVEANRAAELQGNIQKELTIRWSLTKLHFPPEVGEECYPRMDDQKRGEMKLGKLRAFVMENRGFFHLWISFNMAQI